ncbi:MAG: glycosyltransferase family 4 protein [Deltaproteobacteria bacterium]|nr:glycosyltransferase family 4 protein [Deltaproteobacteria bacterium]
MKLGHRVTVVTSNFQDLPLVEEKDGILIKRIICRRKKRFESNVREFLSFAWNASKFLKKDISLKQIIYDISICFHAIPNGIVSYALSRKHDIPYIVMLRGGDVPGFLPEKLAYHHFFSMPLTKAIWKNARYLAANSNGLKALAEKTAKRINRDVYVLRNGVDVSLFNAVKNRPFDGALKMLFVGRLYKQKGLEYLIQAIAGLPQEKRERVSLELAGEGPEKAVLQQMAASERSGNIKMLGYLTREEIIAKFSEVDLFVLPSLYEGMPNALLEAMAGGLPALATDIMGNRELIRDGQNGLLVPPKDPAALRAAMVTFLEQPQLLSTFRERTLARVGEFDWMAVTRQLHDMISAIPSTSPHKAP